MWDYKETQPSRIIFEFCLSLSCVDVLWYCVMPIKYSKAHKILKIWLSLSLSAAVSSWQSLTLFSCVPPVRIVLINLSLRFFFFVCSVEILWQRSSSAADLERVASCAGEVTRRICRKRILHFNWQTKKNKKKTTHISWQTLWPLCTFVVETDIKIRIRICQRRVLSLLVSLWGRK